MQAIDSNSATSDHAPSGPLVLASGSSYRAAQLAVLGLPFVGDPADVDESARPDEAADALASRLAAAKARTVAARHPGAVVIGSDQVAMLDGTRLDKPGTAGAARAQLARASGRTVEFVTALHVIDTRVDRAVDREYATLARTTVTLRSLDDAEIRRYVAADAPLDCTGAFKVEALGIALFERIDSDDPTALVGLPLIATARLLRTCGFAVP